MQRFEALGLDRRTFPYRLYGPDGKPQTPRYFAFKLPIAVDDQAATFVYVDAGQTTDSELRAWGTAHAPLWAALRARTFAVQVVGVGVGADAADRAAPLLKLLDPGRRRAGRSGPHRADPGRPGDPPGDRSLERGDTRRQSFPYSADGVDTRRPFERLMALRQLPEGTPTKTKARGAIDRFQIWSTSRLTGPEAAL